MPYVITRTQLPARAKNMARTLCHNLTHMTLHKQCGGMYVCHPFFLKKNVGVLAAIGFPLVDSLASVKDLMERVKCMN